MKAPVLIALVAMSVISIGSAAVLLFEAKTAPARSHKGLVGEQLEFRWGEGTEASLGSAKPLEER
jgi:uncharacterized protein YdbL (DUF1318 family)